MRSHNYFQTRESSGKVQSRFDVCISALSIGPSASLTKRRREITPTVPSRIIGTLPENEHKKTPPIVSTKVLAPLFTVPLHFMNSKTESTKNIVHVQKFGHPSKSGKVPISQLANLLCSQLGESRPCSRDFHPLSSSQNASSSSGSKTMRISRSIHKRRLFNFMTFSIDYYYRTVIP